MSRLSLPSAASLPLELRKELTQLDLRLRWVSFVKGFGSLLFVTLLLSALFLGLDFFVPLPGLIRFVFLTLLCIAVLALGYRWLVLPLTRQRRWPELAFLIDRSFPDLQERVSSTVELSLVPEEHRALASEFMQDRLRKETDRRLAGVDLWDCLSLSSMGAALAAGLVTAVLAAGPLLWNAGGYSLLWQRLLTPWQNLDSATNLTFIVDDGDRVVPRGDDLVIHARPHWRYHEGTLPTEIRLTWTDEQGETLSREMAFDPKLQAYTGTIAQVIAPLTYELSSRGAQSRTYHVTVADRPRIIEATLTVHPPAYTQRPTVEHEGAVGMMRAIRGSRLVAELRFDHPIEQASWLWSSPRSEADIEQGIATAAIIEGRVLEEGYLARIETLADQSDTFRFDVVSPVGLHNIDEPQRMLQIIPDNAPRISMSGSDEPLKVKPNEIVPIQLTAEDDFGVVDMQLVVEHLTNGGKNPVVFEWKSDKTGLEARRINDSLELALSPLSLKNGDILGYRAVARDARPSPGPNEVWTARRVLIVDDDVKSLAGQEVEDFYEAMQRKADLVKHEVSAHRKQVERARSELDPQPRDVARETLKEERPDWSQTKSSLSLQLDDLSRNLRQRPITEALARLNADPAQELIKQAAAELEQYDPKSKADPLEAIREDEKAMRKAEDLMNRLVNQLRDAERIEQELTELQQLARRSRQLANEAEQLAEGQENNASDQQPGQTPLDELEQDYGALQHDLQELLKRRPELKQAAKNALLSELADAADLAGELAEQQDRLTESLETSRQQEMTGSAEQLAGDLAEAERLASQLAVQSEREAEQTGKPVFNADAIGRANAEREQANRGDAQQTIEQAKAELERYRAQKQQAASLPKDLQQAASALSEKSEELSARAAEQHKQRNELAKQSRAAAEAAKKSKRPVPEQTRKELEETENQLREAEDQLASEVAGLQQAVAELNTPPEKHWLKADTLNQLDGAQDEISKQSDHSSRRLKDAHNTLERLAREVGSPDKRAREAEKPLQSVRDQAESLANRIDELKKQAKEDAGAAKKTAQEIASQPQAQLEQLMRRDLVDQEQKLADAAKSALQAKQQLEEGNLDKAAAAQQEFVEKLDKLKQALAEIAEGKQPDDAEGATTQREAEKAWDGVELPENMKQARLPQRPEHDNQANREKTSEIAKQQAELQKQADEARQAHADDPDSPELKTKLHALADRQRQLAEQVTRQQSPRGALPQMQASRAMREAADALRAGEADQVEQAQKQAARLLEQAEQHMEAAEQPTADVDAQAEALAEKLKDLEQKLAGAAADQQDASAEPTDEPGAPTAEDNQKLLEKLQAMRESQLRVAAQARQLAEQTKTQEPDNTNRAEALEAAAQMAEESEQGLQAGQMEAASESAEQAARQLESALKSESRNSDAQQATAELAQREQELRDQLSQLAGESTEAAAAAQQQSQQNLNNKANAMAEALQRLAEESEAQPLSDRHLAGRLETLNNDSAHATDAMQQALTESEQRNLSKAAEQSGRAQEQLQQLAQKAGELADGKKDTLVPEPVGSEAADASRTLQQAKDSLQKAREAMQQQNQQAAAEPSPADGQPSEQGEPSAQNQPGQQGQQGQPAPQNSPQTPSPPTPGTPGTPSGSNNPGQPQPPSPLNQLVQDLAQAASALEQAHEHMQPRQEPSTSMAQQENSANESAQQQESDADALGASPGSVPVDGSLSGEALRSALMRDWGQQQGPLEADLSDARRRPIDQEYAPLIQRYFESLAAPDAANPAGSSEGQE